MASDPVQVWLLGAPAALPMALPDALRVRHPGWQWTAWHDVPADGLARPAAAPGGPRHVVLLSREPLGPTDQAAETRLRHWLQASGWPYAVLYWPPGGDSEGCAALCTRLAELLGLAPAQPAPPRPWRAWAGCEACSDPDCEHRLFQDLLARRSVQA